MIAGTDSSFDLCNFVIKFEADQVVAGFGVNILMLSLPVLLSVRDLHSADRANRQKKSAARINVSLRFWLFCSSRFAGMFVKRRSVCGCARSAKSAAADAAGAGVYRIKIYRRGFVGRFAGGGGRYLSIGQSYRCSRAE